MIQLLPALRRLSAPSLNPWHCGLQLLALNGLLAAFSCLSFVGGIQGIAWINHLRLAQNPPAGEIPFPYPVLLLLYAVLFTVTAFRFARRLAPLPGRDKMIATSVGTSPLLGLALLGYLLVAVIIFSQPPDVPAATPVAGILASTLILMAAGAEAGMLILLSTRWRPSPSDSVPG